MARIYSNSLTVATKEHNANSHRCPASNLHPPQICHPEQSLARFLAPNVVEGPAAAFAFVFAFAFLRCNPIFLHRWVECWSILPHSNQRSKNITECTSKRFPLRSGQVKWLMKKRSKTVAGRRARCDHHRLFCDARRRRCWSAIHKIQA